MQHHRNATGVATQKAMRRANPGAPTTIVLNVWPLNKRLENQEALLLRTQPHERAGAEGNLPTGKSEKPYFRHRKENASIDEQKDGQKRPQARESPQTVEEDPQRGPERAHSATGRAQEGGLRRAYRGGPGGLRCSQADRKEDDLMDHGADSQRHERQMEGERIGEREDALSEIMHRSGVREVSS
jgi:hypothetical protein